MSTTSVASSLDPDRLAPDAGNPAVSAVMRDEVVFCLPSTPVDAVVVEIDQSVSAARSNEERRRDREIDRTRSKIRKTLPRAATAEPAETWQDVLRRFAESQAPE